MGKQINYWLGYEDFLKIAQVALDCGCIIIKKGSEKLLYGKTLPFNGNNIQSYSPIGSTVIKGGFSFRNDKSKTITRSRLFVISSYYDEQGEYISRPECVTKIYNKLVRTVKKIAPYTVLIDKYISTKEDTYLQEVEWKHKEYISPQYLNLKECKNYHLES